MEYEASDKTIKSNKPRDIWESLREFTKNTCSSESCWLRHQCIKNDIDDQCGIIIYHIVQKAGSKIQMNG